MLPSKIKTLLQNDDKYIIFRLCEKDVQNSTIAIKQSSKNKESTNYD